MLPHEEGCIAVESCLNNEQSHAMPDELSIKADKNSFALNITEPDTDEETVDDGEDR
jgi:hypothetical protein